MYPDCYDPIFQAERIAAEADLNALLCENCEEPINDDYYWDICGDLLCERCAARMYRRNNLDLEA